MWLARRGPEPSPMSLNDRAADRQAHTHSLRLGRVEGFKEAWEALRCQPRPGIPHPDAHAFRLVGFRIDLQFAPAVTVAAHRLDGVNDQVDHHLLNLHPIAPKERQGLGEGGCGWITHPGLIRIDLAMVWGPIVGLWSRPTKLKFAIAFH